MLVPRVSFGFGCGTRWLPQNQRKDGKTQTTNWCNKNFTMGPGGETTKINKDRPTRTYPQIFSPRNTKRINILYKSFGQTDFRDHRPWQFFSSSRHILPSYWTNVQIPEPRLNGRFSSEFMGVGGCQDSSTASLKTNICHGNPTNIH